MLHREPGLRKRPKGFHSALMHLFPVYSLPHAMCVFIFEQHRLGILLQIALKQNCTIVCTIYHQHTELLCCVFRQQISQLASHCCGRCWHIKISAFNPTYGLQVSVSLSANESMPGDPMTLRVQGEKGSCVCVAAVDKSLYLLKPDFQLSPDKVSSFHFISSVMCCCIQAME